MNILSLKNISLYLNNLEILNDINFSLETNQVISILGPSGSGKSSILRLIAGLTIPSEGKVICSQKIISTKKYVLPTGDRNIGLMFQEDVLFPHLTVKKNISFGIENLSKTKKNKLINTYLEKFSLQGKENLYPNQLSGGEKQRVSLARILITNPKILLMDEPFSNLDSILRREICDYTIKRLKQNKISVVFVTHDVDEALRISDKIIILYNGTILQIDTPENLYRYPKSKYIAKLLGSINEFEIKSNNKGNLETPFGIVNCKKCSFKGNDCKGKKHYCIIRPENLKIGKKGIKVKVVNKYYMGSSWSYELSINKNSPSFHISNCNYNLKKNDIVKVETDCKNILIFQD